MRCTNGRGAVIELAKTEADNCNLRLCHDKRRMEIPPLYRLQRHISSAGNRQRQRRITAGSIRGGSSVSVRLRSCFLLTNSTRTRLAPSDLTAYNVLDQTDTIVLP
jgi:hypothetical protein